MRDRFGATTAKAQALRFHAQTGGSTLTAQQPENNIVRVAIQALSAVCGGAQSLHTNSFDEALALPSEHAATIALRTQQILMHEAGTTDTADPLGGSYYLEALTAELEEQRARADRARRRARRRRRRDRGRLRPGRDRGGRLPVPDRRRGRRARRRRRQRVHRRKSTERVELHRVDPAGEQRQRERTARVRAERNPDAAASALALVRETAAGTGNLLPPLREALRARCTVGEICGALRELWGTYDGR